MRIFTTYRERYEYLNNGPRVEAIRNCFANAKTVFPVDEYEKLLDLVADATLNKDDVALQLALDELTKCAIVLKEGPAMPEENFPPMWQERFGLLVKAIIKEIEGGFSTLMFVRFEEDKLLRACLATIAHYPGTTTTQLCRTLGIASDSWLPCGHNLILLGVAKCYHGAWCLTEYGRGVLEELQTKRLLRIA